MPIVRTASDLQRNINEIYDVCERTKEPGYITRNGRSNLVVMDASAYEEQESIKRALYESEMRRYKALMQSEDEVVAGRTFTLDEARAARKQKRAS